MTLRPFRYFSRLAFRGACALAACAVLARAAGTRTQGTVVFFGDSLTAGYGLEDPDADSFPARIQDKINGAGLPWHVVNAGLSGETSAGGLRRIDWVLRQKVDVFVLELGANDGLRGTPPETTRANLQSIIERVRSAYPGAAILVAGMRMPSNLGRDYTEAFRSVFPAVAAKNHAVLIPFLLEGVAGVGSLNQSDFIHPTAIGDKIVAETVWKYLLPVLKDKSQHTAP